jgi:predicted Zn-dependent protease with MMP-like domain
VGTSRVRLPRWRDRNGRFAALVHDEVRAVHRRWAAQLGELAVRVEDVPPDDEGAAEDGIALVRAEPGLLVVYRRPLELRAEDEEDLADLVHEVVVDAVAELLGLDPDDVDPDQG